MRLFSIALLGCLSASVCFAASKPACELLSKTEVEAALGVPLKDAQNEPAPRTQGVERSTCYFRAIKGPAGSVKSLYVTASYREKPDPAAVAALSKSLHSKQYQSVQDVPGLGGTAFWAVAANIKMGQLHVFKGGTVHLNLTITGFASNATALAKAKELALKALPRT